MARNEEAQSFDPIVPGDNGSIYTIQQIFDQLTRINGASTFVSPGLAKSWTISPARANGPGTALRGAKVTLYHFVAGGMAVHYKDRVLPVTAYGSYPVPDPTEDEKTIDVRMETIVAAARVTSVRSRSHPG